MSGIQTTVSKGLRYLANKVEDGFYGEGDNAFQDETTREAFLEDIDDYVTGKMD